MPKKKIALSDGRKLVTNVVEVAFKNRKNTEAVTFNSVAEHCTITHIAVLYPLGELPRYLVPGDIPRFRKGDINENSSV